MSTGSVVNILILIQIFVPILLLVLILFEFCVAVTDSGRPGQDYVLAPIYGQVDKRFSKVFLLPLCL
jgi:hypothetical protein